MQPEVNVNPFDNLPGENPFDNLPEEDSSVDLLEENPFDNLPEEDITLTNYTQDDLVNNDELFSSIKDFISLRHGTQAVDGKDRETIVDRFMNNRRGVASGNSVYGIGELDFLREIRGDQNANVVTGKAYQIYEDMANVFSSETSAAEKFEGVKDYARSIIVDPLNLVGFGTAKFVAGGAIRVASNFAKKEALKAMAKESAKKSATKTTIRKAGEKAMSSALIKAGSESTSKAVTKAATLQALNGQGLKKLKTTGAFRELGVQAGFDSVVSVGMEYGYQSGLVQTGVQEDINRWSLGLAFVGVSVMSGLQAASILRRSTDIELPSIAVKIPEAKDVNILGKFSKSLNEYAGKKAPVKGSWEQAVKKGRKLEDIDSEFFVDMLLGIGDNEGGVTYLKGLSQIAYEEGLTYTKRSKTDKYSNWVVDLIKQSDPQEVKSFAKAWEKVTGVKIKDIDSMGIEEFANKFADKMNASARVLNAASQGAKKNGISVDDYTNKQFLDDALGLGMMTTSKASDDTSKIVQSTLNLMPEKASESLVATQNRVIRLIVTHPSTSALNLTGWGMLSGLGSAVDVSTALLQGGAAAFKKAAGRLDEGVDPWRVSREIVKANSNRLKLMLNPDMTYDSYKSLLELRGDDLSKLSNIIAGGVEDTSKILTNSSLSPSTQLIGAKTDDVIDFMQLLSLTKGVDGFTKSQEMIYQLDKNLRVAFNKSFNDFYTDPAASKLIRTKEYRALEAKALETTLERISSKSYKGNDNLGKVAGFFEDVRNVPGLGLLMPFGRFFNGTVDTVVQNTPISFVAKSLAGKYKDKSFAELTSRSMLTLGAAYALTQTEYENRKKGLAIDQMINPNTGEIQTVQYSYPLSHLKYGARAWSYILNGEEIPEEVKQKIGKDIGLKSFTRNFETTSDDIVKIFNSAFDPNGDEFMRSLTRTGGLIGSQLISGATRPLEPINFAIGVATGSGGELIDRKQGNAFMNKSMRYFDEISGLLIGTEDVPQSMQAAGGPVFLQVSKILGSRPVRLSSTERVMNIMGKEPYKLNAASAITRKAPEAANKYNAYMFLAIEEGSQELLDLGFSTWSPKKQELKWKDLVRQKKQVAETMLYVDNSDANDTAGIMYELASKYSFKKIDNALDSMSETTKEELKFEDLSVEQLYTLRDWLSTADTRSLLD